MRHANARRAQILFAGAIALLVALPACGYGSSTGTTLPDGATGSDDGSSGLDTTLPDGATGSDDGSSGLDATGTGDSPASGDTPIATEDGDRPIASIRVGDRVYSADRGALRLVPVVRVGRVAVFHHRVVEIALSTGAVLRLSAGHPTADGRKIGELMPGAHLDDAIVLSRRDVDYTQPYTYDILPASETHAYVAGGVLVGSTIEP